MTPEKTKEAIMACADAAREHLALHREWTSRSKRERLTHVEEMGPKACAFVDEGRTDKAMRWLGFMQGALWAYGVRDLETLKRMNMPDEEVL